MKFIILPIVVFLTVMVAASAKKYVKTEKNNEQLCGERTSFYSINNGPLVNDLVFEFFKDQVLLFDGTNSWNNKAKGSYFISGNSLPGKYVYKQGMQNPANTKAFLSRDTK